MFGSDWVQRFDRGAADRVNRWKPPRPVRILIVAATRGGDGWLWCMVGCAVALFGGPDRFKALGAANVSAGLAVLLFYLLKKRFRRRRPWRPHAWSTLVAADQFSFPSGHATTAFAVAVSLLRFYHGERAELLTIASLVAVSRVMLGLHFLTDILAGAAAGSIVGYLVASIFRAMLQA